MAFAVKGDGLDFTANCYCDVLPGYFVKAMSVENVASTGDPNAILSVDKCDATGDNLTCVGVALGSVTSGNLVDVRQTGHVIVPAGGDITVGYEVAKNTTDPYAVTTATFTCAGSTNSLEYTKKIGTALATAASGEDVYIRLSI